MKKRFSDDFRASAIVALQAAGYPDAKGALSHVSKSLGASSANLSRWFNESRNPVPHNLVTEKKDGLADLIRSEIYGILKEMDVKRPEASYRDLATSLGIATDKLQLLTGAPTENSKTTVIIEHVDT